MTDLALITGASGGIGLEIAREHARRGGALVIVARDAAALERAADVLRGDGAASITPIAMDLTEAGAVERLVDGLVAQGRVPQVLVNNAGFGGQGRFWERAWADDASMIDLNIRVLAELTRRLLPHMVAARRGRILNVASIAALVPGPLQAVYYATKAFVLSFGEALSEELRGTGVTVTTLLPGATRTQFMARAGLESTALVRAGLADAADVARRGYDGMLAGRRRVVAGTSLFTRVQLATAPLMPRGILLGMVRRMQETTR